MRGIVLLLVAAALPLANWPLFGRHAWRLTLAQLRFAAGQRVIRVLWAACTLFLAGTMLPTAMNVGDAAHFIDAAVLSVVAGFVAADVVMRAGLLLGNAVENAPVLILDRDEDIVSDEYAHHFFNGEKRRGRLVVTTKRLAFRPYAFHVQREIWSARLDEITHTTSEGTRLFIVHTTEPSYFSVQKTATARVAVPI